MKHVILAIVAGSALLTAMPAPARAASTDGDRAPVPASSPLVDISTPAATFNIRGDYIHALGSAERAIAAAPALPWPHYQRAVALAHLDRIDEAVAEYRDAEARFGVHDLWARALARYGIAHALAEEGQCRRADAAYRAYADLVAGRQPQDAARALTYAGQCVPQHGAAAASADADAAALRALHRLATAQRELGYAGKVERWVDSREQDSLAANARWRSWVLERALDRAERLQRRARDRQRLALADLHRSLEAAAPR